MTKSFLFVLTFYRECFVVYFWFPYDGSFNEDEVKLQLYNTIERMYSGVEPRLKLDDQMEKFRNTDGMFGIDMTVITRDKKQPGINSPFINYL